MLSYIISERPDNLIYMYDNTYRTPKIMKQGGRIAIHRIIQLKNEQIVGYNDFAGYFYDFDNPTNIERKEITHSFKNGSILMLFGEDLLIYVNSKDNLVVMDYNFNVKSVLNLQPPPKLIGKEPKIIGDIFPLENGEFACLSKSSGGLTYICIAHIEFNKITFTRCLKTTCYGDLNIVSLRDNVMLCQENNKIHVLDISEGSTTEKIRDLDIDKDNQLVAIDDRRFAVCGKHHIKVMFMVDKNNFIVFSQFDSTTPISTPITVLDENTLATASDRVIMIWDINTGETKHEIVTDRDLYSLISLKSYKVKSLSQLAMDEYYKHVMDTMNNISFSPTDMTHNIENLHTLTTIFSNIDHIDDMSKYNSLYENSEVKDKVNKFLRDMKTRFTADISLVSNLEARYATFKENGASESKSAADGRSRKKKKNNSRSRKRKMNLKYSRR